MAFSLETKLHILLIMTVVGIALYMYLLYKEVKIFQDEIIVIKQQVHSLQMAASGVTKPQVPPASLVKTTMNKVHEADVDDPIVVVESIIEEDEADDDVHSVSSAEIKNILTNIHEDVEFEVTAEASGVCKEEQDLGTFTDEQLYNVKWETLRDYLRARHMNTKGTKAEFVKRILEAQA